MAGYGRALRIHRLARGATSNHGEAPLIHETIDRDLTGPVDHDTTRPVTGSHETDRIGQDLAPARVRATQPHPTRRLQNNRGFQAGHERLGTRVEAAVMGQLHDVGTRQLSERLDRGPLDVAAQQNGTPGDLDADDHGAVVELPPGLVRTRVQPRPPTTSELASFTRGDLDDPDGALGEPAKQEHHRAVRVAPSLAR